MKKNTSAFMPHSSPQSSILNPQSFLKYELILYYRHRAEMIRPLLFFAMVVILFPLSINSDIHLLKIIAPGIIWISVLLATLISLDALFSVDFIEGNIEKLILSPQPVFILVLLKIIAYWLVTCLPLIILTPILGLFLHLSFYSIIVLVCSLLLGSPTLSFVGAIGAALILGLRQGGMLLALLILPLYVPVLIFGTSAVNQAAMNYSPSAELSILAALFFLSFTLAPFAITSALKIAINHR